MKILIKNAKHDIKALTNENKIENNERRRSKKMRCERIGQILWIISN